MGETISLAEALIPSLCFPSELLFRGAPPGARDASLARALVASPAVLPLLFNFLDEVAFSEADVNFAIFCACLEIISGWPRVLEWC